MTLCWQLRQADRDAAAAIVRWLGLNRTTGHEQHYAEMLIGGWRDEQEIVQRIARHRLAALATIAAPSEERARQILAEETGEWPYSMPEFQPKGTDHAD